MQPKENRMTKQLRRVLIFTPVVVMASAAVALAASPVRGGTYRGTTAHGRDAISLKVAGNGRSVKVSVPTPPGYSSGCGGPAQPSTRSARISRGGSFSGSISYEFALFHKTVVKVFFSGRFSGRSVKGTIRAQYVYSKACSGSTSFSARAR
jgi:hypothetical protein